MWHDFAAKHTLKGHDGSVWCIIGLGNDQYATCKPRVALGPVEAEAPKPPQIGGADKSIIIWRGASAAQRIPNAHTDVVRSLCYISGVGVLSAGNDA